MFGRLILFVLVSTACGSESPEPTTQPAPVAAPEPAAEPEVVAPPASQVARVSLSRSEGRALRAQIGAARRLAQTDAGAGYQAFVELIGQHPTNARLYCEAGFLAHRMGNNEDAFRLITKGMTRFGSISAVPTPLRNPVAICLYNRGLVAEAMGDPGGARDSFERSLSLRPNATVERRLAAVRGSPAQPPAAPPDLLPVHTLEELEAALLRRERAGEPSLGESRIDVHSMARRSASEAVPELALLKIEHAWGYEDDTGNGMYGNEYSAEAAIITSAGYRLFSFAGGSELDTGTDNGSHVVVGLEGGTIAVIETSDGPVVRFSVHLVLETEGHSCEESCCYEWWSTYHHEVVALCTLDGPVCRTLELSSTEDRREPVIRCDDEADEETSDDDGRPNVSWVRTLTIDPDGTTHLRVMSGQPPAPSADTRPLETLMGILSADPIWAG